MFGTQARAGGKSSPAWMLEYSHELAPNLFGSFVYLNEGHFPGHHRDGIAAQFGGTTGRLAHGFSLQAALGPYRYFDTTVAENPTGYADAHGTGMVYSLGVRWREHESSPWSWQFRIDHVDAHKGFDSTLYSLGAVYRLRQDATFAHEGAPRGNAARDEVVASVGRTIVNSFHSETSQAREVTYRHAFTPVVRASVGWLNEGDARLIRRNGVLAQGWLEPTFYDGRFSMGVGFGPYLAIDRYRSGNPDVLGMLSTTVSYRIARSVGLRLTWHRSVSKFDRDSDILLAGIGYRF